jgi:hypothetical protein
MAATLQQIKEKVRRLTRSPSIELLPEALLEEYINTFVLYDFPESVRLFYFKTTLTFFTTPFVDTYETDSVPGLENFKNKYLTIHPPVYVAGRRITLSQSRDEFFSMWPLNSFLSQIGAGDGVVTNFSGTLQVANGVPILQNQVSFTTVDSSLAPMTVYDVPLAGSNTTGTLFTDEIPSLPAGTINYVTGAYNITFPSAPGVGAVIQAQVKPYQPSIPIAMLFYDTQFTFRPVPDKAYRVEMDAFIRPTELLDNADEPGLQEFWQYISFGCAVKIFQDRMDTESVEQVWPEFKRQELLCLRRTIVQKVNQRTSTIYTSAGYGNGWGFNDVGYM